MADPPGSHGGPAKVRKSKVIAALFTACKDDDWEIREAAITVLGHRNVADQDTLEALLDAYNDQKWEVRDRAL